MTKPLRILHIEDSEDDTLLIQRQLRLDGFDPEVLRVETAEAARQALQEGAWDVILCDYSMPSFNGMAALQIFQEIGRDIPFILVSGNVGEETAAAAMKAGANDYVRKDNLQRLAPAIERELRDAIVRAQQKDLDRRLRESEERFRLLFHEAPLAYQSLGENGQMLDVNHKWLSILGYERDEAIGRAFSDFMIPEDADLFEPRFADFKKQGEVRDVIMTLVCRDGHRITISLDGLVAHDANGRFRQTHCIFEDVTLKRQMQNDLEMSHKRLERALESTVQAIAYMVETKDPYTAGHQRRVALLATAIADEMGMNPESLQSLGMAAAIHDIGKVAIPSELLSKPTRLSDIEFNLIKTHSQAGYEILKDIDFPWPVATIIRQHHERMDGSGYPQGLKGDEIHLEARIIAVADVVEAIASHRPYRPGLGMSVALEEIERNRGRLYDADVVDACLSLFRKRGFHLD